MRAPRLRHRHSTLAAAALAAALMLAGCTIPTDADTNAPAAAATPEEQAQAAAATTTSTASPTPTPTARQPLIGKTIFIDAGHGGPVGDAMYAQVPDGRGGTTACQSEGAVTKAGLQEQSFTFQTAELLEADLRELGAKVLISRAYDDDSGTCVDKRADAANRADADAFVSLHADAGPEFGYGFYVNHASPGQDASFTDQSTELAVAIRDAMTAVDLTPSTYAGMDGLAVRDDSAELNLTASPAVLVQLANMSNPIEGALLGDPAVRRGYSKAVATGLVNFLTRPSAPVR